MKIIDAPIQAPVACHATMPAKESAGDGELKAGKAGTRKCPEEMKEESRKCQEMCQ